MRSSRASQKQSENLDDSDLHPDSVENTPHAVMNRDGEEKEPGQLQSPRSTNAVDGVLGQGIQEVRDFIQHTLF